MAKKFAQSYIDLDVETASSLNIQKTVNVRKVKNGVSHQTANSFMNTSLLK